MGNIAKDGGNNHNEDIGYIGPNHRQGICEELNEQVGEVNKGGSNHGIPKKLNLTMQVRFREDNMT